MSRTEDVLVFFIASPSDVADERNRFEEAINEWNRAWSRNFGLRLEVIRWENDAFPSIGADAQDVVNRQLPDDYDIFVGMMWSRFGTPTGRAGSGTEEEFEHALSRYRASPSTVEILFYFKDTPIPPSRLDPSELAKVNEFKKRLGSEGVLYWEFTDTDQFEKLVGLHIAKHVQSWQTRRAETALRVPSAALAPITSSITPTIEAPPPTDEDAGYLDFLETFFERSTEVAKIAGRLTTAQQELTARMNQRTEEINELASAPGRATPAQAKRLIARAADDMLQFTNRIDAEIPLFRAAMDESIAALTNAAAISIDIDESETRQAKIAAESLLAALSGARDSIVLFKTSTANLPRMTKELNTAKRMQVVALDRLIGEFENGERLVVEALKVLDALLTGSQSSHP